ncbi:unnamed protein product [Effrenium voratum]|uniref:Transmembrane protein n=1 Tax=Effrenium voratum TaxID=2562239 RepID=A0AA36IXI5_9DINO|nr:unnamed protein product [Effrenium voratum]
MILCARPPPAAPWARFQLRRKDGKHLVELSTEWSTDEAVRQSRRGMFQAMLQAVKQVPGGAIFDQGRKMWDLKSGAVASRALMGRLQALGFEFPEVEVNSFFEVQTSPTPPSQSFGDEEEFAEFLLSGWLDEVEAKEVAASQESLQAGMTVKVEGITSHPELNGMVGTLEEKDAGNAGRWKVLLDGERFSLAEDKLLPVAPAPVATPATAPEPEAPTTAEAGGSEADAFREAEAPPASAEIAASDDARDASSGSGVQAPDGAAQIVAVSDGDRDASSRSGMQVAPERAECVVCSGLSAPSSQCDHGKQNFGLEAMGAASSGGSSSGSSSKRSRDVVPSPPVHTGVLSKGLRLQVRNSPLSLGLRRDVFGLCITFCSPGEVGRLTKVDRSIHEACEAEPVWQAMLQADFWTSPWRPSERATAGARNRSGRNFFQQKEIGLARKQVSQRWQSEVAFRRKQALKGRMQELQAEMLARTQACQQEWESVIKRRRCLAFVLWGGAVACVLRIAFMYVSLRAARGVTVVAYRFSCRFFYVLLYLAPPGLLQRYAWQRRWGRGPGARFALLGGAALVWHRAAGSWALRKWQDVAGVLSVALSVPCVMLGCGLAAALCAAVVAALGYGALRFLRRQAREFEAVRRRDTQEAAIHQEYKAEIQKCRVALGLPPEDKPSCNCRIL